MGHYFIVPLVLKAMSHGQLVFKTQGTITKGVSISQDKVDPLEAEDDEEEEKLLRMKL